MQNSSNVLLLCRASSDAQSLCKVLREGGLEPHWEQALASELPPDLPRKAACPAWDAIVCHGFEAHELLAQVHAEGLATPPATLTATPLATPLTIPLTTPIIVVVDSAEIRTVVDLVKAGAHDVIPRHELARLPGSVREAIDQARTRNEQPTHTGKERRTDDSAHATLVDARYVELLDAVPSCISYIDADERYRIVNSTYEDWFGRTKEEILGRTIEEVVGAASYRHAQPHFAKARSGLETRYESRLSLPNGHGRDISVSLVPDIDEREQVRGFFVQVSDISERHRMEVALEGLVERTATTTGADFFPALAKNIARTLEVSCVIIGERVDERIESLALWLREGLRPSTSLAVEGTPHGEVLHRGEFYCEPSQTDRFVEWDHPNLDPSLDPDSNPNPDPGEADHYFGLALRNDRGQAVGILSVLGELDVSELPRVRRLLGPFADRCAAELERQQAITAQAALNRDLESKVAARTHELKERNALLRSILDAVPLSIFWKDRCSVYTGANEQFLQTTGLPSIETLVGKTDYDMPWSKEERESYRADDQRVIESGERLLGIIETQVRPDGEQYCLETNKVPIRDAAGDVVGILGTFQDITERKRDEHRLERQLEIIEATSDGIAIIEDGRFTYMNRSFHELFGYARPEDLLDQPLRKLYPLAERVRFEREVTPALQRDRVWQGEAIATRQDGSTFPQGVSLSLVKGDVLICVCRDISDLRQAQARAIHNALHDPLTDLPNRKVMMDRLDLFISRERKAPGFRYALLFIDVNRLRAINDTLGQAAGDQALITVSQRIAAQLHGLSLLARVGSDEFAVLLENVQGAERVAKIVETILHDISAPLVIDGNDVSLSATVGIVMETSKYEDASELIRDAETAMNGAKEESHPAYRFFDSKMHERAQERRALELDMRRALQQEEFEVYYQALMHLPSGRLAGFEALVRWPHPSHGLVSPGSFIPAAEETGLIVPLDHWVFRRACDQVVDWQRRFAGHFPLRMSINLSVQDLRDSTLLVRINETLAETGLEGSMINLEVTESMVIDDIDQTIALLEELSSQGIKISVDDFGTGYSSLSYLCRLPVDCVKIDRSFIAQMSSNERSYQVVASVLALSNQLGLTTVAEGIETAEQVDQLKALGCTLGQGYFFSKPIPAGEVESRFFGQ
ncbi:MAG: EAL domain-containing protein [Myxococcota bacterium]